MLSQSYCDTISNMIRIEKQSRVERTIIDFRVMGIDDVHVLGRYRYNYAHPRLDNHTHKGMIEIVLVDKGRQKYFVDERCYEVKGGELFVTTPDTLHSTGDSPEEKGAIYWMQVRIPPPGKCFLNLTVKQSRALAGQLLDIGTRQFKSKVDLKPLLEKIFFYHGNSDHALASVNIGNLLTRFLLEVIDSALNPEKHIPSEQIHLALKEIDKNIARKIRLKNLAKKTGLSLPRFKARFKKEMGIPPAEYIQGRKIELAARLIEEKGHETITRIAFDLGYSSSQYFATVFKQYTGMTPREFRNKQNSMRTETGTRQT